MANGAAGRSLGRRANSIPVAGSNSRRCAAPVAPMTATWTASPEVPTMSRLAFACGEHAAHRKLPAFSSKAATAGSRSAGHMSAGAGPAIASPECNGSFDVSVVAVAGEVARDGGWCGRCWVGGLGCRAHPFHKRRRGQPREPGSDAAAPPGAYPIICLHRPVVQLRTPPSGVSNTEAQRVSLFGVRRVVILIACGGMPEPCGTASANLTVRRDRARRHVAQLRKRWVNHAVEQYDGETLAAQAATRQFTD